MSLDTCNATLDTLLVALCFPGARRLAVQVKVDADVLTIYVPTNEEKPPGVSHKPLVVCVLQNSFGV